MGRGVGAITLRVRGMFVDRGVGAITLRVSGMFVDRGVGAITLREAIASRRHQNLQYQNEPKQPC